MIFNRAKHLLTGHNEEPFLDGEGDDIYHSYILACEFVKLKSSTKKLKESKKFKSFIRCLITLTLPIVNLEMVQNCCGKTSDK